jgi:hypothetical protein
MTRAAARLAGPVGPGRDSAESEQELVLGRPHEGGS